MTKTTNTFYNEGYLMANEIAKHTRKTYTAILGYRSNHPVHRKLTNEELAELTKFINTCITDAMIQFDIKLNRPVNVELKEVPLDESGDNFLIVA